MLAVVEAKAAYKLPGDGLQQAKDYATILGLKFAYSTNGHGIVEFDFTTGARAASSMLSQNLPNCGSAFGPAKRSKTKRPQAGF